jgi:hypothetical protein
MEPAGEGRTGQIEKERRIFRGTPIQMTVSSLGLPLFIGPL